MGALHVALDLAGQYAVSALSAHGQRVLGQMLKMWVYNAVLCHGYVTDVTMICGALLYSADSTLRYILRGGRVFAPGL
jgi:ABC-type amino acid transport system permease subunit